MSVQVGDTILDGRVVIVAVSDDLITTITFNTIRDGFGTPLSVTYNPGQTLPSIIELATLVLGVLGGAP